MQSDSKQTEVIEENDSKWSWSSFVKLALLLAFIGSAIYFFRYTETGKEWIQYASKEHIRNTFSPAMQRLMYVLIYITGTVMLLPGTVLSYAGAALFGAYEGTLYTWIGATIGATLAFLLAKLLGRGFVNTLMRGRFEAFDKRIEEHGFNALLIIRLLPLFPFNGVNFASGLTRIKLRDYVLATAIGIIPGTFIYQFLFAKFDQAAVEKGLSWEIFKDPQVIIALSLFVVFLVAVKVVTNLVRKKGSIAPDDNRQEPE